MKSLPALCGALLMLAGVAAAGDDDPRRAGIQALLAESAWRASVDLSRSTGHAGRAGTAFTMPEPFATTTALMRGYGYGRAVDALEADIHRALDLAAAEVLPALRAVISLTDTGDIDTLLQDDTPRATTLLCEARRDALRKAYAPALSNSLAQAGYARSLGIVVGQYNAIPMLSDIAAPDLEPALLEHGVASLCLRMAAEEQRMRKEPHLRPAGAVSELLAPPAEATVAPGLACAAGPAQAEPLAPAVPANRAERRAQANAATGLRELLAASVDAALAGLGRPGGFQRGGQVRMGLPPALQPAADGLAATQPALAEKLATDLNVAAEITVGKLRPLLQRAVAEAAFDDAVAVATGADDAATRQFRARTEATLLAALPPLVHDSLRRGGAYDSRQALASAWFAQSGEGLPTELEPDVSRCLLNGLYTAIADAERAARHDPAQRKLHKLLGITP